MTWQQLVLDIGSTDPGAVEEMLLGLGAVSVALTDAGDNPVLEPPPGETPLWPSTRLTALFDETRNLDVVAAAIQNELSIEPPSSYRVETLEDREWESEWAKDFRPMQFGKRLWVCPRDSKPAMQNAVVVQLDPGLAFGTGTHATTALCLEWLDSLALDGCTVLDYGCGSGILAIAALKLGAGHATAFDIDPQAVTASRENARQNGVSDRLEVTGRRSDLEAPADIVLANILAGPLLELATEILDLTITGGKLALSGILSDQVTKVQQAYEAGIRFEPPALMEQDGQTWARLSGTRL